MPTVFITNKSGHDFTAARQFGTICFLTEEDRFSKFSINAIYREFSRALKNSGPDDYLLISGPSSMLVVAAAILGHMHGFLNVLVYDVKKGGYQERRIDLGQLV